jgi:hypothetical protein
MHTSSFIQQHHTTQASEYQKQTSLDFLNIHLFIKENDQHHKSKQFVLLLHGTFPPQTNTCMHQTYQNMASAHLQVDDNISITTHLRTP